MGTSRETFLIIAALAITAIGAVYVVVFDRGVPTPASSLPSVDTLDWQTYRNEKYRFEVQYPPSWHVGLENRNVDLVSAKDVQSLHGVGLPSE